MDFFCVSQEALEAPSRCGHRRSPDTVLHHCTMWLGTSQSYRGRVYVGPRDPIAVAAYHEAQHWHLWDDVDSNACETHDPACGWVED